MIAPEIRRLKEENMTSDFWPVYSPFAREHYGRGFKEGLAIAEAIAEAKGVAKEAARVVLLVLASRGLDVPDDARAQITACTDLAQLETWVARTVTVETLQDLFAEAGDDSRQLA
jgi:hypothetical protein